MSFELLSPLSSRSTSRSMESIIETMDMPKVEYVGKTETILGGWGEFKTPDSPVTCNVPRWFVNSMNAPYIEGEKCTLSDSIST